MDAVGTAIRCHGNNVARGREMKNTRKDPGPSCNYKDNRAAPAWKSSYALDVKPDRIESSRIGAESRIETNLIVSRWTESENRVASAYLRRRKREWWEFLDFKKDLASKRAFILRNNSERGVFSFFPFIVRIFPIRFDEHTFSRFKDDSTSIATRIRSVGF